MNLWFQLLKKEMNIKGGGKQHSITFNRQADFISSSWQKKTVSVHYMEKLNIINVQIIFVILWFNLDFYVMVFIFSINILTIFYLKKTRPMRLHSSLNIYYDPKNYFSWFSPLGLGIKGWVFNPLWVLDWGRKRYISFLCTKIWSLFSLFLYSIVFRKSNLSFDRFP